MLRPQFQQKLSLAFLMLASALILIAEPIYAKNSKDNQGRSEQAASRESARQSAPAPQAAAPAIRAPSPAPVIRSPAPAPSPVIRSTVPAVRAPEPSRSVQSTKPVQQPSIQAQRKNDLPASSLSAPRQQNPIQNRSIVNNPPQSMQNRNVTIDTQMIQPQTRANNPVTKNENFQPRPNNSPMQENISTGKTPSVITSGRENTIGTSIGSENRNSSYNSSLNSNSIFNRESQKNPGNNSINRNNSIASRNTESTISSNRAGQPSANLNNRISSDISSHIGSTIGSQPESTTTVRNQENKSSGSRITLPFDNDSGSLRTTPQTQAQRPAAGSSNKNGLERSSDIASRIDKQTDKSSDSQKQKSETNRINTTNETTKQSNNVTPPLNSAKQPAGSSGKSSLDRANTDIGIMVGPDRTPPFEARKPAAGLNNDKRESRDSSAINDNQNPRQENNQTKNQQQNSIGDSTRTNSRIGDTIGNRQNSSLSGERGKTPQNNTGSDIGNTRGRTENGSRPALGDRTEVKDRTNTGSKPEIGGRTEPRTEAKNNGKPEINNRTDRGGRTERQAENPQVGKEKRSQNNSESRPAGESSDRTRINRTNPDTRTNVSGPRTNDLSGRQEVREHRYEPVQPSRITFRDRPYSRESRHEHFSYIDHRGSLYYKSITPGFYFRVGYNRGSWFSLGCIYPYYQRKYVFVSLDGYWPQDYTYMRYYWYGYHPYYWYGYYPEAREIGSDVNYYYTYNYYTTNEPYGYNSSDIAGTDYYSSIGGQPAPQPAEATLADQYFNEAVDAFAAGNYDLAIEKFSRAMQLAPDDMILPFAYSQALFAAGRYTESAEVLRTALAKSKPDKEGVFYPRGLYPDDDVLLSQIDKLADKAEQFSYDGDLQMLLGYQLLGINDLDKAVTPLKNAGLDMKNQQAATVLMNLLTKIKVNDEKSETPSEPVQEKPQVTVPEQSVPAQVEPNKASYDEPGTINLDSQYISFMDSGTSKLQLETENTNIAGIRSAGSRPELVEGGQNSSAIENGAANNPMHNKAKEGILVAAVFLLAGSTGLGHLLRH